MKPENVEPKDSPAACTTTQFSESLRAWCELANESPLPIWIAHSDGAPVHFNSAWQCFTNADSGSGLSAPTIHPDDVSAVESACRQFAFTQLPFHLEFRLRHSVGRYRWQSSTGMPVLTERGVVAGLVVTCIDIQDRPPLERAPLRGVKQMRQLGRLAKIGSWELDLTTMTPSWSDEVCHIHEVEPGYGPTLDEAIKFYHPTARSLISAAVQKAIADGTSWDLELPFITARGRSIWVRAKGQAEACEKPSQRLFGTFQDITNRKLAELALRANEDRFRTLIEHGSDVFFMLTLEGRVAYISPNVERLLGYTPAEVLGQLFDPFLHPADMARGREFFYDLLQSRTQGIIEYRIRHKDGSYRWRSCTGSVMPAGPDGQTVIVGAACDVTDRRQAQETMEASRELFQIVTDSLEDIISVTTPDRSLIFLSPSCFRIWGYTPDEMFSTNFSTRVHPEDLPRIESARLQNLRGEQTRTVWRCRHRDGHFLWMETSANPVRGASGEVALMVCSSRDITERKRQDEEFRQFTMELETSRAQIEQQAIELRAVNLEASAANRAKSEFLANMSHELRTPMTSVLGFADLLLADDDWSHTPENRQRSLQAIRRNGEHLLTIINDILDLSKIEAGKMTLESVPTSIRHLVAEVVSIFQFRAEEKGLSLVAECPSGLPDFVGTDPTRVRQILVNLVGNALKFTESGGVRILVRQVADEQASLLLSLEVIDSGIGIAPEHAARLFQPFTQADTTTSRRFGGTGLGLTISKRMAEVLHGELTVTSELGCGSSFVATIRVDRCDTRSPTMSENSLLERNPAAPASQVYPSLEGCRVLLVEDGPDNQRLISFLLQKSGAEVLIADNGRAAIQTIDGARENNLAIDLILMDMQMPVLDGYSATRELRAAGETRPIIALTANTMSGDRQLCLDAGCDDFLAKPINRASLIDTVARWHATARHGAATLVP